MEGSSSAVLFIVCFTFFSVSSPVYGANQTTTKTPNKDQRRSKDLNLPKEIIVVGSGIAGLAAARTLTKDKTNFTVKVFEAQKDRYGGRVLTDKLKHPKARGIEVNIGAIALNVQAKNNPLIKLAESFELETSKLDNPLFIIPWEEKSFEGNDLQATQKEALEILGDALNDAVTSKSELSVKSAVDKILDKKYATKLDSPGVAFVKCLPTYILGDYSTHNYRPEWRDVGYQTVLLDGMGELIDRLMSGSSDEPPLQLYLNKEVRQIKVDEDKQKVLVRTTDGLQTYADIVIVAVPPSVIAEEKIIFEPLLPKQYRNSVQNLASTAGNQIVVEFEHPFWPEDNGVFIRAVKSDKERGHLQTWINIHRWVKKPVLTGMLTGKPAVEFEKLTDEEAEKEVRMSLEDMFGEEKVKNGGKIVRIQRSQWMGNPLFKGTGVYPKVGTSTKLMDVFAEPLCPHIYFAGEYTSSDSPGTLHGAYNSGVRVADQIFSRFCDVKLEKERRRKQKEKKKKAEEFKQQNHVNDTKDDKDEL